MFRKFNYRHIPLLIAMAFALGPLILLLNTSLKSTEELRENPFGISQSMQFSNYIEAWRIAEYGQAFLNSIIVGIACIIIVIICGCLAAYALAKIEFKGSTLILGLLLFTLSLPMGLFLVPLFFVYQNVGLMDSLLGIILIYSAIYLPFNIFLFRSFFVKIPNELLDSAKIDGCNEMQVITKIIVPLAAPAFLTSTLLVGLWTWNEFFFANAFLQSEKIKTVATRYLSFTDNYLSDWTLISAAGVITIIPIIIIFLVLQRHFIEGLTEGGVKG